MGLRAAGELEHQRIYVRMGSGLWMGLVSLAEELLAAEVVEVVGDTKNVSEGTISELV